VLDPASRQEIAHLPLHNPEPAHVVDGRPFLYDARATSSNGEASCASCHVFGDLDQLAWDLGNPDAEALPNPNPIHLGEPVPFHPLKGPMTTQTLRGMATHGPMHWRGDRTGGSQPGGDPLDEAQAFAAFIVAFDGLLGHDGPIADEDMRRFGDFILEVSSPPNPIRALDGSLTPAQQAGRDLYFGRVTDLDDDCVGCHALSPRDGFFGTDGQTAQQSDLPQMFKVPHLRNLYTKVGMFQGSIASSGPQIRGFGFMHDGSADTVLRFLRDPIFRLDDVERGNLQQFLFTYDSELAPVVGQQVTLTATNAAAAGPRLDLLVARAAAGDCELMARGALAGEERGWLRLASGLFAGDRSADAPVDDATLRAQGAVGGQELTYTCVPLGSGARTALDRDADGALDHDEIDAGSDPADAASTPGGPPVALARVLIGTSSLRMAAAKGAPGTVKVAFASQTKKSPDANRIVPPPRGTTLDPSLYGATLVLSNAQFTDDVAVVPLPASGWRAVGPEKKPKGYRYKDDDIRVVLGRDVFRVRGDFAYSLDEAAQGRVAVRLAPGVFSDAGWCAVAPARPQGPFGSTVQSDRPGRFRGARRTPAPDRCPLVPTT
jgi:hypothetical protein